MTEWAKIKAAYKTSVNALTATSTELGYKANNLFDWFEGNGWLAGNALTNYINYGGVLGDTWAEIPHDADPGRRYGHAACYYDGYMYVFGGYNSGELNDLWKFNLTTYAWTEIEYTGDTPTACRYSSMVAIGSHLYIFGGNDGASGLATLYEIDLSTNVCTQRQSLSVNRYLHTAEVYNDKMYVIGGMETGTGAVKTVWEYTPGSNYNYWTAKDDLDNTRYKHGSQIIGSTVYLFSGDGGDPNCEAYDIAGGAVVSMADMPDGYVLYGQAVYDEDTGDIYLQGGQTVGGYSDKIYLYDVSENTFTEKTALSYSGRALHTCIAYDGKLWLFGGLTAAGQPTQEIFIYYFDEPSTSITADYLAIRNHNLNTIGASIVLQYRDTDGTWQDAFTEYAPTSDGTLLKEFTSQSSKNWRLKISGQTAAPYMGVCVWGKIVEFDFASTSFDPQRQNVIFDENVSESGFQSGSHEYWRERRVNLRWNSCDSTLMAKFAAFRDDCGVQNFFLLWEGTEHPTEVFFLHSDGKFNFPLTHGGLYQNVSLALRGRKDEAARAVTYTAMYGGIVWKDNPLAGDWQFDVSYWDGKVYDESMSVVETALEKFWEIYDSYVEDGLQGYDLYSATLTEYDAYLDTLDIDGLNKEYLAPKYFPETWQECSESEWQFDESSWDGKCPMEDLI